MKEKLSAFFFFEQYDIQSFLALFLFMHSNVNNTHEQSVVKIVLNSI